MFSFFFVPFFFSLKQIHNTYFKFLKFKGTLSTEIGRITNLGELGLGENDFSGIMCIIIIIIIIILLKILIFYFFYYHHKYKHHYIISFFILFTIYISNYNII